jgi:hypothetical protein
MKVVFWNVQRIGNIDPLSEEGAFRYGYFFSTFKELTGAADLIILCEVSQKGDDLAKEIQSKLGGWSASYVAVGCSRVGTASPCGFLVAANNKFAAAPRGGTTKRPAIAVEFGGKLITACHIIATGGDPSKEEILVFLDDMESSGYLIGDMNFRIEKWDIAENKKEITARKIQVVKPGARAYTFQSKNNQKTKLIDYLFAPANTAVGTYDPTGSHDFDIIDHAPVGYIL